MGGGSTQLWHLDNGHGRPLSLLAALTDRAFDYAAVGGGTTRLELQKGIVCCSHHVCSIAVQGTRPIVSRSLPTSMRSTSKCHHQVTLITVLHRMITAQDSGKRMLDDDQWDAMNKLYQGSHSQ